MLVGSPAVSVRAVVEVKVGAAVEGSVFLAAAVAVAAAAVAAAVVADVADVAVVEEMLVAAIVYAGLE